VPVSWLGGWLFLGLQTGFQFAWFQTISSQQPQEEAQASICGHAQALTEWAAAGSGMHQAVDERPWLALACV
jgi:hypothetical protein